MQIIFYFLTQTAIARFTGYIPSTSQQNHVLSKAQVYKKIGYEVQVGSAGTVKLQALDSVVSVWADTLVPSIRFPQELLPPSVFQSHHQMCRNGRKQECFRVENINFYFHAAERISDFFKCSLPHVCLLKNNGPFNASTEIYTRSQVPIHKLKVAISSFLNITLPEKMHLPNIVYNVTGPSLYVMWLKPIFWIFDGSYHQTKDNISTIVYFKAKIPLVSNKHLNGVVGITDLCKQDPQPHPTNPFSKKYKGFMATRHFFCPTNSLYLH
ncbi:hypothetical protein DSO57_1011933 [Entomophthora muscae]|uniref:Uncharacterized protein n=1 Tax=Entomophthora muscae TaxID=34485 RepID=A0ACC2T6A3_9FUNG|nr:hypothetical protein DSO57_1011933 [Entomophthora muscae]